MKKKVIIPSLIAKNQKEFNERFAKVKNVSNIFQLDVMDGNFVKNKSLMFDFALDSKKKYEAHLMVKNPEKWILRNWKKVSGIVFHFEAVKNPEAIIRLIKSKKRKAGIAIKPSTKIERIIPLIKFIDLVLILTVRPGKYGAKFIPKTLEKVREVRKLNKKIDIEIDGGINPGNIKLAAKAGANKFIVGSFLQKSDYVKKAFDDLKNKAK